MDLTMEKYDQTREKYDQRQPATPGYPWRKVTNVEFLEHRRPWGFAAECDVWRHTLECGHKQDRTDSRAFIKKARCWECCRQRGT